MTAELTILHGHRILVDKEDLEKIIAITWHLDRNGYPHSKRYVAGRRSTIRVHRLIVDVPKGYVCDHINGDKLDNRKSNLRICFQGQNSCNKKRQSNNTSGFIGVSWHSGAEKWMASVCIKKKTIYLGLFKSAEDAAVARDAAAKKMYGEFARLNFTENNKCES